MNRPADRGIAELEAVSGAAPPVAIVLNAAAGPESRESLADRLVPMLDAIGINARVVLVRPGEEPADAARRAADAGVRALVAAGGDGTVSAVASVAIEAGVPLGVLPLGTLNHFAKDLGIPLELEAAARVLAAGHETRVDVGEVNGRVFVNNSSLGLYPRIVRHRERERRRHGLGKWAAFTWALVRVLRRHIYLTVGLDVEGTHLTRRTPFVFVGNNEYQMESLHMGARTCLNAGRLGVVVARRPGRWGLIRLALRALLGRIRAVKDFDAFCTQELGIETHHAQLDVATDGEVTRMDTPLRYRVRQGALRVIVPAKD